MARRKRKTKIGLDPLCALGTLAHNRSFSPSDYRSYLSPFNRPSAGGKRPPPIKILVKRGVVLRVSRGKYYPTEKGWKVIERACRRR